MLGRPSIGHRPYGSVRGPSLQPVKDKPLMTTPTIELKPSAHPLSDAEREAILAGPGFGRHFTDHMVTIKWTGGRGWHDGRLVPYAPISLDPATTVLHYAQEIFEGLKAYRRPDGSVATFRPEKNAERFQRSARRLARSEEHTSELQSRENLVCRL